MTRYDDLCDAYFEWEPRAIVKDQIIRELPLKMREAIKDYLAAPEGAAPFPTMIYNTPTLYVDFYRREFDHNGARKHERCGPDHCVQIERDGICHFTIGIWMAQSPAHLPGSMAYLTMRVEDVGTNRVDLTVENLSGLIAIELRDPASYASAAATIIDRLTASLRDQTTPTGRAAPIGFDLPAQLSERRKSE